MTTTHQKGAKSVPSASAANAVWSRAMLDNMAPMEIRSLNRQMYRHEQDQPGVKWMAFQEQRRKEEKTALRFERINAGLDNKEPTPVIENFIRKLRFVLNKKMKKEGGTAHSIIRQLFLHWDADSSGQLDKEELKGAMNQLGVPFTDQEASSLVEFYDNQGIGQMSYKKLVADATKDYPDFLTDASGFTGRLMGNAKTPAEVLGIARPPKNSSPMIRAFQRKLKQVLAKHMRDVGGTECTILRALFLKWDITGQAATNSSELRGALKSLGLRITPPQADEIVQYYARTGNSTCFYYMDLVNDISQGEGSLLAHPSTPEVKQRAQEQKTNRDTTRSSLEDFTFTARPHRRPPNKVVEAFKIRLRDQLELIIKFKGGVHHAIIREAFLFWDVDNSGKISPTELVGAINRIGLELGTGEAQAIVDHYDLDSSGEMDYQLLCKDIKQMAHNILSYIEDFDVLRTLSHTVRDPQLIREIKDDIKKGVCKASDLSTISVPPKELLLGTCLRFDTDSTGSLDKQGLAMVWKELGVRLKTAETEKLIAWYDHSASRLLKYREFAEDLLGPITRSAPPTRDPLLPLTGPAVHTPARSPIKAPAKLRRSSADGGRSATLGNKEIMAEKHRIEKRIRELEAQKADLDHCRKKPGRGTSGGA